MVKKKKAIAKPSGESNNLGNAVKDSAQQIWLAGLGAFAKAQEEGSKVFEALVKEGVGLQNKTLQATNKVSKAAGDITKQATEGWDKLESVFEDRVARTINRLGMPTTKDISTLRAQVEELSAAVTALGGKPGKKTVKRAPRQAAPSAVAPKIKPAAKRPSRKTAK